MNSTRTGIMACQNQIQTFEKSQVSFPAEIVVEILLKLSNRSLLRCRSVCKLWHSLISDPYFVHSKYLASTSSFNTNIDRHRLIFSNINICKLSDALYDKSVSNKVLTTNTTLELSSNSSLKIAASCDGLVCFYDDDDYKYMFIWNPTTRVCNRISLGFYLCSYGFGYDESTDDYKFLAVCKFNDKRPRRYALGTRIYSVKSGMWNAIGDFPHYKSKYSHVDGKYSNGAFHWLARQIGDTLGDRETIVSFHLATETYGQVLQPEYDDEDNSFVLSLGALGEELCMLCHYYARRSVIWVMKVYGVKESWTKLFSLPETDGVIIPRYNAPLFISNDGKILFKDSRKLFVYDSKKGSDYEIQNFELYSKACIFVESLVSPMPTPAIP